MHITTWSAPRAPSASAVASCARSRARTRSSTASSWSIATIVRATLRTLTARAMDEPIKPRPMMARRSNKGCSSGAPSRSGMRRALRAQAFAQGGHDQAVRLRTADGQAERVGEAVGFHPAQHQPASAEERVRVLGGVAGLLREMDEQEIADARRHLEPELADLFRKPG